MKEMTIDQANQIRPGEIDGEPHFTIPELMSMEAIPVDHSEFNEHGFYQVTPEQEEEWKRSGPIGFIEAAQRQDKTEMIPFNPESAGKLFGLMNAVYRLKANNYQGREGQQAQDFNMVNNYLAAKEEERVRGYSISGAIAKGAAQLPGFMTEFLATGGVGTAAKKGVEVAAKKVVGEAVEKGVMKFAVKSVGMGANAAARTTFMPHRVAEGGLDRLVHARIVITDKGGELAKEAETAPFTAYAKAFGDVMIENFSEMTGPGLTKIGAKLIPPELVNSFAKVWKRLHPNESATRLFTAAGYNGFLQELGEERIGDILRAVTGVEDFGSDGNVFDRIVASLPSGEQLLVEAAVLAIPGVGRVAANQIFERLPNKRLPKLQEIPDAVADMIAAGPNLQSEAGFAGPAQEGEGEEIPREIPDFNKESIPPSDAAILFGDKYKGNPEVIDLLKKKEQELREEGRKLEKEGKDGLKSMQDAGVIKEAIYRAEGTSDPARKAAEERILAKYAKELQPQVPEVTPEEKADYELFMKDYMESEQSLSDAVKRLGGIRSFKSGKEIEEYKEIPNEFKNKEGVPLDEMASELAGFGFQFESGEELRQALINLKKEKTFKVSQGTKDYVKQKKELEKTQKRNKAMVLRMGRELSKPLPPSKVKSTVREATGQTSPQGKTVSEKQAFLQSLKDRVKAAAGARKATREEIFDTQNMIVDLINESDLEANDKAKFLKAIKNIQTFDDLEKMLPEIEKRIATLEEKEVRRGLVSEIKETVARAKEGNTVAIDFIEAMEGLLSEVDLQQRTDKTLLKLNRSIEFFKAQIASGKDVEIPESLLQKMNLWKKKGIEDIPTSELKDLLEKIQRLAQQGETKLRVRQNLIASQKEKDLAAIKQDSVPIVTKKTKKGEVGERLSSTDRVRNKLTEGINLAQEKNLAVSPMDVIFDLLDGVKKYVGANYRIFKAKVDKDFSAYLLKKRKTIDAVAQLAKKLNMDDRNFERIGVHAAREQEGGLAKLIDSGLTEEQVKNIVLTSEEMQIYQAMRKAMDSLGPEIEEVMRVVYNQPFERVTNYFSFMTDFEAMSDTEIRERFSDVQEFGNEKKKNVQKGFTLSRTLGQQKIKLNAMEIFERHIDNASYLIHVGPTTKYLGELAATPEYGEAVGELGQELVRDWVDLLARKGRAAGDRINILDTFRKNVGAATLGFKLSSALIQPTAFFHGASFIGNHAFDGAFKIAISREWRKFVMDNFPEIKSRVGDDPAFLDFGGQTFIDKAGKASFWALQQLDLLTAASIGAGAYIQAVEAKGGKVDLENPDKEAIQEAQRIVRRSQSSSFFKDAPAAITRGGLSGNPSIDRLFLQFQSFVLNEWSVIQHDLLRSGIKSGNYAQAVNMATFLILAQFAEMGLRRVSKELIAFMTDADLDDWDETFKKEFVMGLIEKIPFVSQVVSAFTYGSLPVPAIDIAKKIVERFQAANTAKRQTTKDRNFIRGIILSLGALFGLPGTLQAEQIYKDITKPSKMKK